MLPRSAALLLTLNKLPAHAVAHHHCCIVQDDEGIAVEEVLVLVGCLLMP